jgi:AcrR family transcriptional regulator
MMTQKRLGRPAADPLRNLRADLLRTSRELLDEKGPAALSMREVARRTGCTHQAPYHYFADREAILAALVTDGFNELALDLRAENQLIERNSMRDLLVASGDAYISFAQRNQGVFRIMFSADICNPERFPEIQQAGQSAKYELKRLAEIVSGKSVGAEALGTTLWAHVHGLASLLVEGRFAESFATESEKEAHLKAVSKTFADMVLSNLPPSK